MLRQLRVDEDPFVEARQNCKAEITRWPSIRVTPLAIYRHIAGGG